MVFYLHPFRESVDNGCSDAVKASRKFIALSAEFASGVKDGENDLKSRYAHLRVNVTRDPSSVVPDRTASVGKELYLYPVTFAGKRLVDRVVHYLVDKVMQTPDRSRSDIHSGTYPYGFKALKDLYLTFVIYTLGLFVDLFFVHSFIEVFSHFEYQPFPLSFDFGS